MLFNKTEMLLLGPKDFQNNKVIHKAFKGKMGMIMIGAEWCGFCKMLKPEWARFKKFAGDRFIVAAVDAVKHKSIAKKLDIHGFPTIFKVSNGKLSPYTDDRSLFGLVTQMCKMDKRHPKCHTKD